MDVNNEDRAWAAGFFDGEGSVSIGKPRGKSLHTLYIRCTQKRKMPLLWLKSRWGGSIYSTHQNGSTRWHWSLSSKGAAKFLVDTEEYLKLKRTQARIGIKLQSMKKLGGRYNFDRYSDDELMEFERMRLEVIRANGRNVGIPMKEWHPALIKRGKIYQYASERKR